MIMSSHYFNLDQLQAELEGKNPRIILKHAFKYFDRIAISFSGAEDVVLIDMACQLKQPVQVFTLDTGRLHPETYRFIEEVRNRYPIKLDILYPDPIALGQLVSAKGLFSFYEDGHQECCALRKVEPLQRKVVTLDAWITGQRKDQSQETRQDLREVQEDERFSSDEHQIIKFNPLVNWTSAQVWDYIEAYQVPYNPLHKQGYRSIGCEPCTRPTLPHQHEREGRWWWEGANKKECGLHVGKPKA